MEYERRVVIQSNDAVVLFCAANRKKTHTRLRFESKDITSGYRSDVYIATSTTPLLGFEL